MNAPLPPKHAPAASTVTKPATTSATKPTSAAKPVAATKPASAKSTKSAAGGSQGKKKATK